MGDMEAFEPATDLFDQWLAHHEGRSPELLATGADEPAEPERGEPDQPAEPAEPEPQVQPPTAPEPGFPPLPVPDQHAAAASVLAALTGEQPLLPRAAPTPAPAVADPPQHRPTHLAPSHLAPTDPVVATNLPDQHLAAASVIAELTEPTVPAVPSTPPAAAQPEEARGVPERAASLPHTIFFKPRAGTQRLLGILLLGFVALTSVAALWAWGERTFLSYGVTAAVAAVTAIVWATRASASPTRLTLRGSELEIVRDGSRALFDLAGSHTVIEVRGEPQDRHWKVLILRRSMRPYVIDGSMVDPGEFTQVLRFYRPEL